MVLHSLHDPPVHTAGPRARYALPLAGRARSASCLLLARLPPRQLPRRRVSAAGGPTLVVGDICFPVSSFLPPPLALGGLLL